jgi:hemoglobin
MLVNSLVWMVASIVVAVVVMERMMRFNQITDDAIRRLVDDFYAKVRADPELGPVFARDPGDWTAHLATMRDFWSSVMLTSGHYKGNPVAAHRRVEGIELPMFKRWLALFDQTCGELFEAPIADAFRAKATRIAESLKLAMFYRPDRPWPGSAV